MAKLVKNFKGEKITKEDNTIAKEVVNCDATCYAIQSAQKHHSKENSRIARFLKDSTESLQKSKWSCCKFDLDDQLAIFVGWSAGYGDAVRDDCIQDPAAPDWALNASVKLKNDADWCDYGWLDFPVVNGEVWDTSITITPEKNWIGTAKYLYESYLEITKSRKEVMSLEEILKLQEIVTLSDGSEIKLKYFWDCDKIDKLRIIIKCSQFEDIYYVDRRYITEDTDYPALLIDVASELQKCDDVKVIEDFYDDWRSIWGILNELKKEVK